MPEELVAAQSELQQELKKGQEVLGKQQEGAESYVKYQFAFGQKVDEFRQLSSDPSLSINNLPAAKAHYDKGADQVQSLLRTAAADGSALMLSSEKGETTKEARAQAAEKLSQLADNLLTFMSPYKEQLTTISGVEKVRLATEDIFNYARDPYKNEMVKLLTLPPGFYEKVQEGVADCGQGLDLLKMNDALPEPYKSERQTYFTEKFGHFKEVFVHKALQDKMADKKYAQYFDISLNTRSGKLVVKQTEEFNKLKPEEQQKIVSELAQAKIETEQNVEVAVAPQVMANYYLGIELFEKGDLEGAKARLTQFVEKDAVSPEMAKDKRYGEKVPEFKDKGKKLLEEIDKQFKDNADFFEGQKLAQGGNMPEAKNRLKKFLSEHGGKPTEKQAINYPEAAKELLKRIAQTQLEELKQKFESIPKPDQYDMSTAQGMNRGVKPKESLAYKDWIKNQEQLKKLEELFNGSEVLDLAEFISKNFPNLEDHMVLHDAIAEDGGREGLLALARKYREQGNMALAAQYFKRYFAEQLGKVGEQKVTIESLKDKYRGSTNVYGEITGKIKETEEEYRQRFGGQMETDDKGVSKPLWQIQYEKAGGGDKFKEYYENKVFERILPEEIMAAQQADTSSIPAGEIDAWNEFATMQGIKPRTIGGVEIVAVDDETLRTIVKQVAIQTAIMAVSAGVANIAAAGVRAGVSALAASRGLSQGATTLLAETTAFAAEAAVFTGTSVSIGAAMEGKFNLGEIGTRFSNEVWSGAAILGAFKLLGVVRGAFSAGSNIAEIASRGAEMGYTKAAVAAAKVVVAGGGYVTETVGFAMMENKLDLNTAALVLGLKLAPEIPGVRRATERIEKRMRAINGPAPKTQPAETDVSKYLTQEAPKQAAQDVLSEAGGKPKAGAVETGKREGGPYRIAGEADPVSVRAKEVELEGKGPDVLRMEAVAARNANDPVKAAKLEADALALEARDAVREGRSYEEINLRINKARRARFEAVQREVADSSSPLRKNIDRVISGRTVDVNVGGRTIKVPVDRALLTPETLARIADGEPLQLTPYDVYLHEHLAKDNSKILAGDLPDVLKLLDPAEMASLREAVIGGKLKGQLQKLGIDINEKSVEKFMEGVEGARSKVIQGADIFKLSHAGKDIAKEYMSEYTGRQIDEFASKMKEGRPPVEIPAEKLEALKEVILKRAIDQQIDNPPEYVSHGFDHSLRVMDNVDAITKGNREVLKDFMKEYGINEAQAVLMMKMTGILHDLGYPDSAGFSKALHAAGGAALFIAEIAGPLGEAAGLDIKNNPQHQALIKKLADAIQYHGADKKEDKYENEAGNKENLIFTHKVIINLEIPGTSATYPQEFLITAETWKKFNGNEQQIIDYYGKRYNAKVRDVRFDLARNDSAASVMLDSHGDPIHDNSGNPIKIYEGRYADFPGAAGRKGENAAGIEYKEVDLYKDPLGAVIRFADNLDMTEARFSEYQITSEFREYYERLGAEREVSGNQTVSTALFKVVMSAKSPGDAVIRATKSLYNAGFIKGKPTIYEGEIYMLTKNIIENSPNPKEALIKMREIVSATTIYKFGSGEPPIAVTYKDSIMESIDKMIVNAGEVRTYNLAEMLKEPIDGVKFDDKGKVRQVTATDPGNPRKTINSDVPMALTRAIDGKTADKPLNLLPKIDGRPVIMESEIRELTKKLIDSDNPKGSLSALQDLLKTVRVYAGNPPRPVSDSRTAAIRDDLIGRIRDGIGIRSNKGLREDIFNTIADGIKADVTNGMTLEQQAVFGMYAKVTDEISYRHFGGCRPVENTGFDGSVLVIRMKEDVMSRYFGMVAEETVLLDNGLKGKIAVPINAYQIWRALEASSSLLIDKERMKIKIEGSGGRGAFVFDPADVPPNESVTRHFIEAYRKWEMSNLQTLISPSSRSKVPRQ